MKILELKVMRGPNIWSNFRQRVIIMKLDLQDLEKKPTHRIEGFSERIKAALPSLYSHRCSVGNKGGFFERVEQGTWMGHVIEHIALELQTLAGTFVGYGRTRSTGREGVYNVVFAYRVEEAGLYAARAAVRVAECLINGRPCNIDKEVDELKKLSQDHGLRYELDALTSEARELEIPFHFAGDELLLLGYGINQVKMRGTITSAATHLAMEMAGNRDVTMRFLREAQIPVPAGTMVHDDRDLAGAFAGLKSPVILKPLTGNHNRKACITLRTENEAATLLPHLQEHRYLYAEEFLAGDLYRVLMVSHRICGVVRQKRTKLTGNGSSTIGKLTKEEGIELESGQDIDTGLVLAKGQQLWINGPTEEYGLATFDNATQMTLQRASMHLGLTLCGIDMILCTTESDGPCTARIISVDARPDLVPFLRPARGNAQNVIKPLYRMLLGDKKMGRIPLVAVRGNGDSPVITHLLAHICVHAGRLAGSASSKGMTIAGYAISTEDCTGATNVRGLLFDPCVDTAVIECSTQVMLNGGLPFDTSEISIITGSGAKKTSRNSEEHETEEKADMVAGRTTPRSGYNILNADTDFRYYAEELYGTTVLYSLDAENAEVIEHCSKGGLAAVAENDSIVMLEGQWRTPVLRAGSVHRTDREFLSAALPAALAAWLLGIKASAIAEAMGTFRESATEHLHAPYNADVFAE